MSEKTPPTPPTPEVSENTPNAIEQANEVLEKMETVRDKTKALVERAEALKAENLISGSADAGQSDPPKETEDEKWAREAKVRYAGTGMDPTE